MRRGAAGGAARPLPLVPPHLLPQALHLRRSVEELESWLEALEVKLRAPVGDQDQPGLDELLGAQGELEAAVAGQARQAQWLLGQARVLTGEGRYLAQDVEDQARQLLPR